MTRGGKRIGAGRKPALSFLQRISVGARCEGLWREAEKENEDAAIKAATRRVSKEWADAHRIPVHKRKAWMSWGEFETHLENVYFALREDQGIDAEDPRDPARVVTITPKRPKGQNGASVRWAIITRVAAENALPGSTVDRCWKEFRSVERDIEEELGG